jgi:hypothetical protein
MKLSPAGLLWIVVAAAVLSARSAPSAAQTSTHSRATLGGVVSKEPGSEAVKKAVIELIAESQTDGGNYTALTGVDGSFRIEGIAPGRYHLFVERPGYLEVDKHRPRTEGRVLTLSAGQDLKDLAIHLQEAAVVEGRVTDEDGDPLPNAQVAVLRQTFVSGHSHWEQVGAERTNDLGEYRVAGLAAGSYYVSVTPPPDFKSLIEASGNASAGEPRGSELKNGAASEKPAPTSYQTTYYPGTRERSQAAPIQLHAGDEFPANFSLTPSPALIIRGSVVNLPAGTTAAIMLQSKDFSVVQNGAEVRKDGSFEIRDVAPGAYTILATVENAAVPMMARQMLQVTSGNVDGLRLTPQPGATIRGRVRLSGNANPSSGPAVDGHLDLSQLFLVLRPTDGEDEALGTLAMGDDFATPAHVNADGSVEWKNVPAGHYYVQLAGDASGTTEWFLKSAVAGGTDVADAGFAVSGSTAALDLVVSANGAIIEGIAANDKGEPVADAVVVAMPEARLRSQIDRFRSVHCDQSGRFSLHGLPPGDYTLFAWESIDGEAYYDPAFLKSYEGQGIALHVNEGERTSVHLETIPAPADQPTESQ